MCDHTVLRKKEVQDGAEYAGLGGLQSKCRGFEIAHSHHMRFALQDVQDPDAERAIWTQDPELGNKLREDNSVEC